MKRILFTSVFVLLLLGKGVFAEELQQKIDIAAEDQVCKIDWDCAVVDLDCQRVACECSETAVNKKFLAKYQSLVNKCREEARVAGNLSSCDKACQLPVVKCIAGQCQVIIK